MANLKKRPSKSAKAAKKIVSASPLLSAKAERSAPAGAEFIPANTVTRTSGANKLRPEKKKG